MSTSQRPRGVSLPSIQEMFPEHLMQRWYPGKPPQIAHPPTDPASAAKHVRILPAAANHSSSASPPCDFAQTHSRAPPHARGVTSGQPLEGDVHRHHAQAQGHPAAHRRHSESQHTVAATSPSHARTPYVHPYAFDVFKTDPIQASASSGAMHPPSAAAAVEAAAPRPGGSMQPTIASMRKVRPSFRVQQQPKYSPPVDGSFAANGLSVPSTAVGHSQGSSLTGSQSAAGGLAPHMVSFHPSEPLDDRRHHCPHCDKRFNRPSSLDIHVNTHTGAKPFLCPYPGCNRKFNVNSNMRRHWRNHMSKRRREGVAAMSRIIHPVYPSSANPSSPPPLLSSSPSLSQTGSAAGPYSHLDTPLKMASSASTSRLSPSLQSESSQGSRSSSASRSGSRSRSPSPPSPDLSDDPGPRSPGQWNHARTQQQSAPFSSVPPHQPRSFQSGSSRQARQPQQDRNEQRSFVRHGRTRSGSLAAMSTTAPYSETVAVRQRACSIAGCDCQPVGGLRPAFGAPQDAGEGQDGKESKEN